VTIIRGAGKCFSAGYDLGGGNEGVELPSLRPRARPMAEARHRRMDEHLDLSSRSSPRSTATAWPVAASWPPARSGVRGDDAKIGYPAVRFGVPDMHFHAWTLGMRTPCR